MNRTDAVEKLRAHADAIKATGVVSLYLFGSTATNTAQAASDLDLFVDYDPDSRFNAFDLVGIKLLLEKELALPVDLTTRDGLHPMLKADIERAALRVF